MCDIAIDSAGPGAGKLEQVKGSGIFSSVFEFNSQIIE